MQDFESILLYPFFRQSQYLLDVGENSSITKKIQTKKTLQVTVDPQNIIWNKLAKNAIEKPIFGTNNQMIMYDTKLSLMEGIKDSINF